MTHLSQPRKRMLVASAIGLAAALGLGLTLTGTAHAAPNDTSGHDASSGADFVYDSANPDAGATITALSKDGSGNLMFPSTVHTGGPNGLLSVTGIGTTAAQFSEVYGQVTVPDSVTNISLGAFRTAQIGELQLGSGMTVIERETFQQSGISAVKFPPNLIEIGDQAFEENSISVVGLPDSLILIGDSAFEKNNLTEVTVPDRVTGLGSFSFADNPLAKITIGKSVRAVSYGVVFRNDGPVRAIFKGPVPAEFTHFRDKGSSLGYDEDTILLYPPEFGAAAIPDGFTSPVWMGYRAFPSSISVNFVSNGGSTIASKTVNFDDLLNLPTAPTKIGNLFTGWYLDQDLTTAFDVSTMQRSADLTLYAAWKTDDTVTPDPGGPKPDTGGNNHTKPGKTDTLAATGGSNAELMAAAAAAALLLAAGATVLARRKLVATKK